MGKHSKTPKPGFWATVKGRAKAKATEWFGPHEVARATMEYTKDGEYIGLRPRIQPYPWRHYVAPEDIEIYAADIGGLEFEFELLPESGHELKQAAYDAAAEHYGPYVDSQPLNWLEAVNDNARAVLPAPLNT